MLTTWTCCARAAATKYDTNSTYAAWVNSVADIKGELGHQGKVAGVRDAMAGRVEHGQDVATGGGVGHGEQ